VYVTLVVVALGEIIQAPRYYDYISRLAPPGQQGTYMGFAFLPIGIGSLHWRMVRRPRDAPIWRVAPTSPSASGGLFPAWHLTALLLWIYDRVVKPSGQEAAWVKRMNLENRESF